jgi:hypothetical protein
MAVLMGICRMFGVNVTLATMPSSLWGKMILSCTINRNKRSDADNTVMLAPLTIGMGLFVDSALLEPVTAVRRHQLDS